MSLEKLGRSLGVRFNMIYDLDDRTSLSTSLLSSLSVRSAQAPGRNTPRFLSVVHSKTSDIVDHCLVGQTPCIRGSQCPSWSSR